MDAGQFKADLIALLPRLRARAILLTGSRAAGDDLLQDTLLRAWRFRDRFQNGSNLSAWVGKIMRNLFYTSASSQRRMVAYVESEHATPAFSRPEQEWRLRYGEVIAALERLSASTRDALLLVVAEGLSYEAAAEVAGCPAGTMKSRVHRARRLLHAMLAEPPAASCRPRRAPTGLEAHLDMSA
jgi:RNA polymerase sigma-70 factor (ECF subfamily)